MTSKNLKRPGAHRLNTFSYYYCPTLNVFPHCLNLILSMRQGVKVFYSLSCGGQWINFAKESFTLAIAGLRKIPFSPFLSIFEYLLIFTMLIQIA